MKGVSPLIASVLLIAFTMSVAVLFSPFASNLIQDIQSGTSQKAVDVQRASKLGIEIEEVNYNQSSRNLSVVVRNSGERIDGSTNLSIGIIGEAVVKDQVYDVGLDTNEVTALEIPLTKTYPLEMLRVSMTDYPVEAKSGIRCIPTYKMQAYYPMVGSSNEWVIDYSENDHNGSINGAIWSSNFPYAGSALKFSGGENVDLRGSLSSENLTDVVIARITSDQGSGPVLMNRDNNQGEGMSISSTSISYGVKSDAGYGPKSVSWSTPQVNKWYVVGATMDEEQNNLSLYVDGELRDTLATSHAAADTYNLYLGYHPNSDSYLSEAQIGLYARFNRTLNREEINRFSELKSDSWAMKMCKLTD